VVYARRVIAAAAAARKKGRGAVSLDGAMIDASIVERARGVIALAERIAGTGPPKAASRMR